MICRKIKAKGEKTWKRKNHAVAYVDGSYSNNTAGYGVVFFHEDAKEPEYFSGRCKNASMNNVSGEIEVSLCSK